MLCSMILLSCFLVVRWNIIQVFRFSTLNYKSNRSVWFSRYQYFFSPILVKPEAGSTFKSTGIAPSGLRGIAALLIHPIGGTNFSASCAVCRPEPAVGLPSPRL